VQYSPWYVFFSGQPFQHWVLIVRVLHINLMPITINHYGAVQMPLSQPGKMMVRNNQEESCFPGDKMPFGQTPVDCHIHVRVLWHSMHALFVYSNYWFFHESLLRENWEGIKFGNFIWNVALL